nr:hypothetical protein OG296_37030 [Streptomyces sp. NBC_01001]
MEDLSAERQALRVALLQLEATALQGRDRTAAIKEATKRRKNSELPPLQPTTVGGWFEKGTPAKDFATLWALVEVLYEWSGRPQPDSLSGPAHATAVGWWRGKRELWQTLYRQAKRSRPAGAPPAGGSPAVKGYLAAVRKTAKSHPYPDAWGDTHLPDLTDVYVRQQATPQTSADHDGPGPEVAASARSAAGPAQHAEEVFYTVSNISVLLAPAGSGKSTLLRTHRANSAGRWLQGEADATVPVLVDASVLTTADPLPAVLAKAAANELTRFGLLDELAADLFRHPPRPKTPWLVLVDGLDEIPDTDTRHAVMQTITETAAAQPALYRFVVASRPLPARELDTLGPHVPRFELQPFSPRDLQTYATNWFRDLNDPARHAQAFTTGLERSHLDVLAHTPLMAFLLCRLYRADPSRPLPHGRTGVYQACVELLYELNTHKNIKTTHDEAIRHLKDRHQIPRDNLAAEQAAGQVREHLPELIDYLAHERINGNTAPAVEIFTSHLQVNRPQRLKEHLWNAFIGDLLRPTGLLTEHRGDFHFLHQTFLEYHAARHATRDEQARMQLLDQLFPRSWRPRVPAPEPSYLGFLLDALLASPGGSAAETTSRLETLTHRGGTSACQFLVRQLDLRTNLFTESTARQLTRFAQRKAFDGFSRVAAARGLAAVEGYGDAGADQLTAIAEDSTIGGSARVAAARGLAAVEGYQDRAVELYARLAEDTTFDGFSRLSAARGLGAVEGYQGRAVQLYARLAVDSTIDGSGRVSVAEGLAAVEGYRDAGADQLTAIAEDSTISGDMRVSAARALAAVEGYQGRVAQLYARLAVDSTIAGSARVAAARALAAVEGLGDEGADRLTAIAEDSTIDGFSRVAAARGLAAVEGYGDAGAGQLTAIAEDSIISGDMRVAAARGLAAVEGYQGRAAQLYARLANDTTLDRFSRVSALQALAGVRVSPG